MYSVNMAGYYNVANDRTIAPEIETYFSPGRYPAVAQALKGRAPLEALPWSAISAGLDLVACYVRSAAVLVLLNQAT
jgi:hypothetical protein